MLDVMVNSFPDKVPRYVILLLWGIRRKPELFGTPLTTGLELVQGAGLTSRQTILRYVATNVRVRKPFSREAGAKAGIYSQLWPVASVAMVSDCLLAQHDKS